MEEKKPNIAEALDQKVKEMQDTLKKARGLLEKGNPKKALPLLTSVTDKFDRLTFFSSDEHQWFLSAEEPFEFDITLYKNPEEKRAIKSTNGFPFAEGYYLLGKAHCLNKKFEDAARALQTALKWNPSYFDASLLLAQIGHGNDEKAYRARLNASLEVAFRPRQLEEVYGALGASFASDSLYAPASYCYLRAIAFAKNGEKWQRELYKIEKAAKKTLTELFAEAPLDSIPNTYGFLENPERLWGKLALTLGKQNLEAKMGEGALYYLNIALPLLPDVDVKSLIAKAK